MCLQNKIDFVMFISATNCNPNGDPLNGNRPRMNTDYYGEISDVCIKRKMRNRMLDMGNGVFVQSDDKCLDGHTSLKDRAENELTVKLGKTKKVKLEEIEKYKAEACEKWLDVRSFGQLFAFGKDDSKNQGQETDDEDNNGTSDSKEKSKGVSVSIRGPVTIRQAVSCSPIDVSTMQITKSVRGSSSDSASDTMGSKHMVNFGVYSIKGSINVQLAEKTGFTDEDAEVIKECLRTLFVNDASAARPDGSMEVIKLYWWKHNCKEGQYSSAKVHRSVKATLKEGVAVPTSWEDYTVTIEELDGLAPEIIDGI